MKSFSFIVDENLPPHLVYWLREKGHIATHVNYEGLDHGLDENIWSWAASRDAVIVSRDEDFHSRVVIGKPPRLISTRWHNTRKKALIEKLEIDWQNIEQRLNRRDWFIVLSDS